MDTKLPIVYVRGFAGGTGGINKAVDDPFYGFNEGSAHVRVNSESDAIFYQFESPMLRLMQDEGYTIEVHGDQRGYLEAPDTPPVQRATLWVHRFYDRSATTFDRPADKYVIEVAALDLFTFVKLVREKTGADQVDLVAHSMGGLICRSLIQRMIPEAEGELNAAQRYVRRLFTYATPHGGIDFSIGFGLLEKARDLFDIEGTEIFGRSRMHTYLTPNLVSSPRPDEPPEGWDPAAIPNDCFPAANVFCLVGTNPDDYDVAHGLASRAVGVRSDGLVQIDNAYVRSAHRSYVHRCHSGRYGIVNSEEGYQNLRRFLFADLEASIELEGLTFPDSSPDLIWQLEAQVAIRGLPSLVFDRSTAHHCPIQIEQRARTWGGRTSLLTTFLKSDEAPEVQQTATGDVPRMRYALSLRFISLGEKRKFFLFHDHLEQVADFADTLLVDIEPARPDAAPRMFSAWVSEIPGALRSWQATDDNLVRGGRDDSGAWGGIIALPASCRAIAGSDATLVFRVSPRAVS